MRFAILTIFLFSVICQEVQSQPEQPASDSLSSYFTFDDPAPLSCLYTWLPPFFIQHGIEMKSFIRSRTFRNIRKIYGDRKSVDAIYIHAMQLTNNNTAVALFLSAIATFDHRTVGFKIPFLSLFFPLSNESDEEFDRRLRHLPVRLYDDTPPEGDRDKLQHFFGSAFLTVFFESAHPAVRIGDFIEVGEDAVIVGGVDDIRDRRTNRLGSRFGRAVLDDNHRLPSEFFKIPIDKNSIPDSLDHGGK